MAAAPPQPRVESVSADLELAASSSSSCRKRSPPPGSLHTFEDLLDSVGAFGLYQRLLCLGLVGTSTFVCALTYYTQVLVLLSPPLRCGDVADGAEDAAGHGGDAGRAGTELDVCGGNRSQLGGDGSVTVCQNWTYDTSRFFATITSENNWVCGDDWRPFVIHAVFWIGNIVGSWVWGSISDRLGRRPATLASFLVYSAGGALTLLRPSDMLVLAAVRFLVGTAHHTISHLPYMLVIEFCGASARVFPLLALIGSWGAGGALLPWIAYALWDWRILMLVSSLPLLLTLAFYKFIPESCSWLMVHGRGEEAAAQLRRIAAANGREVDERVFTEVLVDMTSREPDKEKQSILLVRTYPRLLRNMALVILLWMISCLCFYGHTQNTGNLGGSVLSSFSLGATTELLAMTVPFIINLFGRRRPMALFFLTSGLCGMVYALLGHRFLNASNAEYTSTEPHQQTPGLPLLIIGAMSLVGAAVTLLLPETGGKNLPQTLLDGDLMGRDQSLLPCRRRTYQVDSRVCVEEKARRV